MSTKLRKPKLSPPSWLNDTANKLTIAYGLVVVMAIAFCVIVYLLIAKIDEKNNIVVIALDGSRTAHIGPGQTMDEKNNPLWATLAHNCSDGAFSMDNAGPRRADLIETCYSESARKEVKAIQEEWRARLKDLSARVNPVISKIKVLRQLDGIVHVIAGGYLELTYSVGGQVNVEDRPFMIVLALGKNSDYAEIGAMPYVCVKVNQVAYDNNAQKVLENLK